MANKKLSPQERINLQRQYEEQQALLSASRAGEPTYEFTLGEPVLYGARRDVKVAEVLHNRMVYVITIEKTIDNKPCMDTRIVPWFQLRKTHSAQPTNFATNQDLRLHWRNTNIHGLLHAYHYAGIDMSPAYQRDLVWTKEDQIQLLDSVFSNTSIGSFLLYTRETSEMQDPDRDPLYEIVDGKQRLHTLVNFFCDRLAYRGYTYTQLSSADKNVFLDTNVSIAYINRSSRKDILRIFLMLNKTGHVMSAQDLAKAENLYIQECANDEGED